MKKSIKKTLSLLLCTAMMAIIMLPQAAFAATDYTCYIGSNGYSTLAEAVEAANTGDTIWMTANDSVSTTFDVDKNLTIELEGYTLANACMRFVGDITVNINDRAGTAKINTNQNSGFKVTDYESDSRVRAAFYLTGGAKVILSGTTGGTEIYGGAQCTDGLTILEKAAVVGKGCELVINGGSLVYSGYTGTDGVFVCDTGILTLKDILIRRSSSNIGGSSISYANVPTIENPLTITKGHFYGGMWVEGSSTINGVYISRGTLSFDKIEKALLYTSVGSYIDYDKSTNSNGWEIFVASENLSTDTDIDNVVDSTETLRVSAGGNVSADAGQKVVFQPQVTGGDGMSEITYAWTKDGADTGVTTDTFVIEETTSDDAGEYVFTATQGNNSVSCTFVLSVQAENHSHHDISFDKWSGMNELPQLAGNYYLENEVTLTSVWTAPQGVTNLCLNGKSINLNSKHIAVENGATLNIYDCGDTVRYYDADSTTGKWTLKSEGTSDYTTEGGVITGGSSALGGAISVNDATLNLYGGNLAGNTASSNNGGAVYITKGTLTIDGANILGNYAYCNGGGVFANQSTVTINDGRISYNRACITDNKGGDGGGIYLSNCTTTMNGASITHNTNLYDGAGIMNSAGGTLTVNGGTISDNTTTFWGEWSDYCGGAGICNDSDSTLILNDGTIANNIGISKGAGVFNRGTFNMNGATIEGNICISLADNIYKGYGDGVANEAGAVFTMTDGYIGVIHNDLVKDDTCRGVYNRGTFTMTGGEIFASSDDMSSCYGLSNSSDYSADGTETSSAVANIGGNAVITGQCGYKPFAVNGTGTVNVSGNAVLTAKNVDDCKDNRSRAIYLSRGTLNVSGNPELISLHDFSSSNPPDTNGIRFEPSVTVNLSGGPVITAAAHIQLEGTPSEPSKYFNIVGKLEKPVSPYVVVKRVDTDLSEGAFTNGWTEYMSDAEHDDYFTGPEGYGVLLYENELRLAEHAHKNIIYSAWEEIDSLPTTAGNYRLESDVTISETWNVPAGVTNLCLNGHKITYTGNSLAINLVDNVELNVTDCKDGGMLYAKSEEDFTGEAYTGIWITGGKFTMDSGKIYVKNTYPKANVRAIVARNGASLSLSGEAIVEAYGSGAPFGLCTGSEATINISDDAYIYAENIDPSARDGRVRAVYGETGAVINIYGSPVIEAYSPSTTNAVNAIRLNESTAVFNGTPALIAKTDSGLAAEVHCEKITDLISVNCNLENDTIYRVYKPSSGVFTASANTEYNDASKFASAIDDYKVTKESDGQLHIVEISYYTITAVATEGGNAEGTSTVKEGENVTFTAVADEGYEFIGWFEGEIKVCETEKFVVENVTEDKTYTARFALIKVEEPEKPVEPEVPEIPDIPEEPEISDGFEFTSLRTLRTREITVNHNTRTINITPEDGLEYITIFQHQSDVIPGGIFKMSSYMGNKVEYNKAGSYRVYFTTDNYVTVKAKITIGDVTKEYFVNVGFNIPMGYDFTSLKGEGFEVTNVNHEDRVIDMIADDVESIILYSQQHNTINGGKLYMSSYLGNRVVFDDDRNYTVYADSKQKLSVKVNIFINNEKREYTLNIQFPKFVPKYDFDTLDGTGFSDVSIDHSARTVTIYADNQNVIKIPIEQDAVYNGKFRMASYMGNKVSLDLATRLYTITRRDVPTIQVKANLELGKESREYLVTIIYIEPEWGFETLEATNVDLVDVDHTTQTVTMNVAKDCNSIILNIDQICAAGDAQVWMKSYNGNKVTYNASDRTYTIKKGTKDSLTVSTKITMLGETRYYDIVLNFATAE